MEKAYFLDFNPAFITGEEIDVDCVFLRYRDPALTQEVARDHGFPVKYLELYVAGGIQDDRPSVALHIWGTRPQWASQEPPIFEDLFHEEEPLEEFLALPESSAIKLFRYIAEKHYFTDATEQAQHINYMMNNLVRNPGEGGGVLMEWDTRPAPERAQLRQRIWSGQDIEFVPVPHHPKAVGVPYSA